MIKFGTGGWRAIIGDEFTKKNIQKLCKALSMKMQDEGVAEEGLCIGYDRRFLSKESLKWACEVFAAEGIPCKMIMRSSPTPLIMYYVMAHDLPYGVMVTASHNPAIYNGMKIFTRGGRDADEKQTCEIEDYLRIIEEKIEKNTLMIESIDYDKAVNKGLVIEFNPINEYIDSILSRLSIDKIRRKNLRVAIDPLYGVSSVALKTILAISRCEVEMIHEQHDTLFGGKMPAPNEETLRALQIFVLDRNADIGLATDGDADRIGVIDDKGGYLHANDILVLLYYYLLKYKGWKGPVVRNIATTHRLDRVAAAFGENCYEVPVGFKYVSAKMQETDAVIGGESSGGLTVRGHINGKDGVYAASLLVEMIAVTGMPLSELSAQVQREFGSDYMEERSYTFSAERKQEIFHLLMEEKKLPAFSLPISSVSYLDGCKVRFGHLQEGKNNTSSESAADSEKDEGWIIARFSGTEPLLRIFCEHKEKETAEDLVRQFEEFLDL